MTKDLYQSMDIRFWDETLYLFNGINLFRQPITPDWGPLYSILYYILHLIIKDPISLYYFNFALMAIVPSIALYFLLSELNNIYFINFFISYLFLISEYNLPIWPKVSSFCMFFIFLGLIVIRRLSNNNFHYPSALILVVMLSYIRPEYSILVFPLVIIILIKFKEYYSFGKILSVIVTAVLVLSLFGIPYSSERSYVAYAQAFEKYLPMSERIDKDGVKGLEQIMQENFGGAKTIFEIFKHDFDKASKHVIYNLKRFPNLLLNISEVLIPSVLLKTDKWFKSTIVLIISAIFFYIILIRSKNNSFLRSNFRSLLLFSIYLTLPAILSINLFYPRAHYIILLLPPLYFFSGKIFSVFESRWVIRYSTIILVALGLISILIVPSSTYFFENNNFFNRESIFFIRRLNIQSQVNLLENEGNLTTYLSENYHWVDLRNSNTNFITSLSEKHINMIFVTPRLKNLFIAKRDSSWLLFQNNFEKYNFISKTDGDKFFLLNKDLIKE
ncbi:MAG: hypothetical protein DAHOPDDO_01409 [Ignavibacteriaceae bacterium]|nr:hypothetical protein [Ignavibacteriaceae bacterium]